MASSSHRFRQAFASIVLGLAASLAGTGHSLAASVNVLPANWATIATTGAFGTLRAGSIWTPEPVADVTSIVDGTFLPPGTVWNQGTHWWDADSTVNASPVATIIQLSNSFALDRFVVQADDNDVYQIDYWDSAAWQAAYTAPAIFSFGMQTRDSGLLAPITTDRLRITASGGDGYYSISEIQAFSTAVIPLPGALLLFVTGAGAFGLLARRRSAVG